MDTNKTFGEMTLTEYLVSRYVVRQEDERVFNDYVLWDKLMDCLAFSHFDPVMFTSGAIYHIEETQRNDCDETVDSLLTKMQICEADARMWNERT
jgi:hypothetical protein